jgi:hypothetical protein
MICLELNVLIFLSYKNGMKAGRRFAAGKPNTTAAGLFRHPTN